MVSLMDGVQNSGGGQKKFWAFISYSHQDDEWAKWLHRSLEQYRVPAKLVGRSTPQGPIPKRIYPIFRDREELPGSASLGEKLTEALENSRSLIVICSPNSAISRWVNQEVLNYKALGNFHRVFCFIVGGEPGASAKPDSGLLECFPEAIRYHVDMDGQLTNLPAEPIAADARPGKDGKQDALIKLLAGILDVDFDALKQREVRRRRWQFIRMFSLVVTVLLALAVIWYDGYQDRIAADAAKNRRFADLMLKKSQSAIKDGHDGDAMYYGANALKHRVLAGERPNDREKDFLASLEMAAVQKNAVITNDEIFAVVFAADGNYFVAGAGNGTMTIFNRKTGKAIKIWRGHDGAVSSLVFSPDGKRLISAGADGRIKFWAFPAGHKIAEPLAFSGAITAMAQSRDGVLLAVATLQRKLLVWDLNKGAVASSHALEHRANALLFTKDEKSLLVAGDGRNVWQWRFDGDGEKKIIQSYKEPIRSLALGAGGDLLAVGSWDTSVYLWSLGQGRQVAVLKGHDKSVEGVAFHPNGQLLASVSLDETVAFWEVGSWSHLATLAGHGHNVTTLDFSRDGKLLVTGSRDKSVRLWQLKTSNNLALLAGHEATVRAVVFHPDGRHLVSAGDDMTIRSWDLESLREVVSFRRQDGKKAHDDTVRGLALSPDGAFLVSGGRDRALRIWSMENGQLLNEKNNAHDHWIFALAYSHDGKMLATASYDGIIKLWSLPELRQRLVLDGHGAKPVGGLAFSPDGSLLASASDDMQIGLWSTVDGIRKGSLLGHEHVVRAVLFSPDGKKIISSSADTSIRVWDLASLKMQKKLLGHHLRMVWSLALGPKGEWLVSGSHSDDRQTLRLWNLTKGVLKARFSGHKEFAVTAAINRQGTLVASGGTDKMVRLWSLSRFVGESEGQGGETDFLKTAMGRKEWSRDQLNQLVRQIGKMTNLEMVGSDALPIVQPDARAGTNSATRFNLD